MPRFEYTTTPSVGGDLNQMGQDGWELAGIENALMYWKRQVEGADPLHDTLRKIEGHLAAGPQRQPPQPARPDPTNPPNNRPEPGIEPTARSQPTDRQVGARQVDPTPQGHRPPRK